MKNFNRGGNKFGGGNDFKRDFRKPDFDRGSSSNRFELHRAVCSACGNECEVPFRPTSGKPVYCNKCFKSVRENEGGRFERREAPKYSNYSEGTNERRSGNTDEQLKKQLESLNWKLDKIIKLLTPVVAITQEVTKPIKVKKDFTPLKFKKKKGPNKV